MEDECGGIPDSVGDPFQSFGKRLGRDRAGIGLGLSIARKAARPHGGDIHIRNIPDKGCVFVIDLPLAAKEVPVSPGVAPSPVTIVSKQASANHLYGVPARGPRTVDLMAVLVQHFSNSFRRLPYV